jgi:hypothetical protein
VSRLVLDQKKLEACAQALFRTQQAQRDGLREVLGDEPSNQLWMDLVPEEHKQLVEQAYIVLRVWGVEH